MADTSTPRLSPTAEPTGYAPYALTAVLAAAVAGVFALTLLVVSGIAFATKQAFTQPLLLALPLAALALAFAGRRQILGSEGTRAGLELCTVAWWVAVLGGLGYAAYLGAVVFAIRQDAATQFEAWAANIAEIDPTNPRDAALFRAFHMVIDPGRQDALKPTKIDDILAQRREEVSWFRQSDVVRMAARNPKATTFTAAGLQKWEQDPRQGLVCELAARMRTPEGEFGLTVPMTRQVANGRPVWQIVPNRNGYVTSRRLTRYGQYLIEVEQSAAAHTYLTVLPAMAAPATNVPILKALAETGRTPAFRDGLDRDRLARVAVAGGTGFTTPTPADAEAFLGQTLFATPEPAKDDAARQRFLATLRGGAVAPAGVLAQSNTETNTAVSFADDRIEARVPVELRAVPAEQPCRGVVVLVCTDPDALAKVKELRAAGATETPGDPKAPVGLTLAWRLHKVVSDMKAMPSQRPGPADDGGGGMPGMGGR